MPNPYDESYELDLPVAEIETKAMDVSKSRVRLKGQHPDDKCLIEVATNTDIIKTVHDTKKRGGTVWLRLTVKNGKIDHAAGGQIGQLVIRDVRE